MIKSIKKIVKILSIMLISIILLNTIEVYAIGVTNEMLDNAIEKAEKQEIEMFNTQFTLFVGDNVSVNNIKSLISTITKSNSQGEHKVWINSEGNLPKVSEYENSKTYKVSVKSYDDDGYISIMSVELNPNASTPATSNSTTTIAPNTGTTQAATSTPTIAQSTIPQTGISDNTWIIIMVIILVGFSIFAYKKVRDYKDIK